MPSLPSPIGPVKGQVEFVQSLCISPPVTPGLILMLNYFSFANDVARLQSNHPEYVWWLAKREQVLWRCSSITVTFAPIICSITDDPALSTYSRCLSVFQFAICCACIGEGPGKCITMWVCDCLCLCVCVRTVTLHLDAPHSVITSINAEYAWLHS